MLALAALAVADAFRRDGGGDSDRRGDAAATARAAAVRRLRQAGVTGELVATFGNCGLRAFRLPGLQPVRPPEGLDFGCEFEVSPDGRRLAPPGAVWHPWSGTYAICRGRAVDVLVPPNGRPTYQYEGCAPAWRRAGRPEESLTVAREEGILEVRPFCAGQPPCERLLVSSALLRKAAIGHPATPSDLRLVAGVDVQAMVWLTPDRAAVLLRARLSGPARRIGPLQLLALVDERRLRWTLFDPSAPRLTLSPLGTYLVAEPRPILRTDGSQLSLPPAVDRFAQAVAWSPDERWLAVATRSAVVLMRVGELERFDDTGRRPRTITLPIAARDLAWRRAATVRP